MSTIQDLHQSILSLIFCFLEPEDLCRVSCACQSLREGGNESSLWLRMCAKVWTGKNAHQWTEMLEDKANEGCKNVDWKKIFKLAWQVGPLPQRHFVNASGTRFQQRLAQRRDLHATLAHHAQPCSMGQYMKHLRPQHMKEEKSHSHKKHEWFLGPWVTPCVSMGVASGTDDVMVWICILPNEWHFPAVQPAHGVSKATWKCSYSRPP